MWDMEFGMWDLGHGTRIQDLGFGMWDMEFGIQDRDTGFGIRDLGFGIWDFWQIQMGRE